MSIFDAFTGAIVAGSPAPSQLVTMPKNTDVGTLFGKIGQGAADYYTLLNQINTAKYGAKLTKAQLQALVNEQRAGGQYRAQAALTGYPSPSLLIVGGVGLAALLLLRR